MKNIKKNNRNKTNKTKVLFLDHLSLLSGGEKSLLDIITHIDRDLFEPILVCPGEGPLTKAARKNGVNVYIVSLSGVADFSRGATSIKALLALLHLIKPIKELVKLVKKENCQIIYTNSMKAHFIGSIVAKITRKKLIWHVRDILDEGILLKIFTMFTLFPNKIICISEAVKNQFKNKVPSNKLNVIYNGILPTKRNALDIQIINQDKFTVGIVGQIADWKGQDIFIEAANILSQKYKDIQFLIVGEVLFQKEEAYKKSLCIIAKDNEDIHFLGYRSDVPDLLSYFDLLVHASKKPEPFGRVIIEAMEASVPVVATKIGGPIEIIEHEKSGLLYEQDNEIVLSKMIEKIYLNKELREKLKVNGKKRFNENFHLNNTINRIEKLMCSEIGNVR